jgi:hypothetical protein
MARTWDPQDDYSVMGNSTSSVVGHPNFGTFDATPSCAFLLTVEGTQTDFLSRRGVPEAAVVARRYTKGLVLFRTNRFGYDNSFFDSVVNVSLPYSEFGVAQYARVLFNGSLQPLEASEYLSISGYEGIILVDMTATSVSSQFDTTISGASLLSSEQFAQRLLFLLLATLMST